MNDHVLRCRQMLEEQITQLGTLRNANPRDPGFKLWRQNTLTVLQRIWPGDSTRSERFRRIAFSPSHGKPDGQTVRDWYTRGCTDTTAYLTALIDMIDREGVPPAPDVTPEALPSSAGTREDDFPVLDLPAQGGGAGRTLVLGQSDSLADMAAMPGTDSGREAGAPAPPQLKIELKGPVTTPEAPQSLVMQRPATLHADVPAAPHKAESEQAAVIEPRLPATSEPPIVTPSIPSAVTPPSGTSVGKRPARAAKPRSKSMPKPKLKDMLGLGSLEAPHAAVPTPTPTPAPEPVAPPVSVTPAAPVAPVAPVAQSPAPEPAAAPAAAAAAPAAPEAQPIENEHDLPVLDDAQAAQATQDFMRMSPVLGLQGKPVQRTSDDTGFQDPDAIAVATLAADTGRLGVPDDSRDKVRDTLLELARQFEAKSPQWAALQKAVTVSMDYPELARRLMPVVLPWMHRAA